MGENRNYAALDWVIGEIDETLKQARQALEAYVENPKDSTRIRFCLTHIHQVHGSLQMVEFFGAALLAEEMENLSQALMNESVKNEGEAQEVLMRAILQLPVYLEQVKSSRRDHPSMILPLLNDLRAVRGESLLTETKLFSPDLSYARKIRGERLPASKDNRQFTAVIKKLRQMYQYAAAGVIRNVNLEENLAYLNKVFGRLYKLTQGTARQSLWEITLALGEGLVSETIESSVSVKNLLRQLDKEIKTLSSAGIKALDVQVSDELLKNLLYYIARSTEAGPHVKRIKRAYHLDAALPVVEEETDGESNEVFVAPDPEAIKSVVTALKDELDSVKHALDSVLTGNDDTNSVDEALPVMKRVADTMAVLGIGHLRKETLAQCEIIETAVAKGGLSQDVLMRVAGKIIEIEGTLEGLVSNAGQPSKLKTNDIHIDKAQESVLRESRNGLEQAKGAIIEYIASQWNRDHLMNVPGLLEEIRGGLGIIPLARPARILRACASYIQEQLLDKDTPPEWTALDTLADAIASVEYYLERLSGDHEEDDDLLLGVAEESVEALGYAVTKSKSSTGKVSTHSPVNKAPLPDDIELAPVVEEAVEIPPVAVVENVEEPVPVNEHGTDPIPAEPSVEAPVVQVESSTISEAPSEENDDLELDEDIDEEILEIFIEEASEVLEAINEFFPKWAQNFEDEESLTEFRRAFHTLKGSGRMVNALDIGELAWSVENMLNRIIDGSVTADQQHIGFIERVRQILPDLVEAFSNKKRNPLRQLTDQYQQWGEALSKGDTPAGLEQDISSRGVFPEPGSGAQSAATQDSESASAPVSSTEQPDTELPVPVLNDDAELNDFDDDSDSDAVLWKIFGSEAIGHLQVVDEYIQEMTEAAPLYAPPSDSMQRALHTLKGSAHMADIKPIAELATPLERFVKELRTYQVPINDDILQLVKDGVAYTHNVLDQIENGEQVDIPKLHQFVARVGELKELSVGHLIRMKEAEQAGAKKVDPGLLAIFMAEEMNLLLDADKILLRWQQASGDKNELDSLIDELSTLENGAEHANLPPMANLSGQLRRIYEKVDINLLKSESQLCELLHRGHEYLLDMVDAIAAGQNIQDIPIELQNELEAHLVLVSSHATLSQNPLAADADSDSVDDSSDDKSTAVQGSADESTAVEPAASTISMEAAEPEDTLTKAAESVPPIQENATEKAQPAVQNSTVQKSKVSSMFTRAFEDDVNEADNEILEIFTEEADELLEEIEESVNDWEEEPENSSNVEELKRILHTFKGGARLAGLMNIGELAHEFETLLINLGESVSVDQDFFVKVHQYQDYLIRGTERVKAILAGEEYEIPEGESIPEPVVEDIRSSDGNNTPQQTQEPAAEPVIDSHQAGGNIVPFAPKAKSEASLPSVPQVPATAESTGVATTGPAVAAAPSQFTAKRSGPQEVIKVPAELLEELVNLAGETSISRGRMEEQVSELGFAIDEMDATIVRLQEQLRRLDIETEAQVLFRQEQMAEQDDFDPLEMDRYSQLQQLSRSLIESASDLMDLKSTLLDKTRDAETLLIQQSRINTELQEGLMRSRMVPFSRLVPRLRRIVRQISGELGKQVTFELDNIEGELDRSVLERMVAPLEHMLRNAVDHGIESTEQRLKAGKPETGRIVLSLGREGGDVLLRLADDGKGVNLDRVREKAIERGLMRADAKLSDQDVLQFIIHAGFSTAEKVTQISGRGVGMDVVNSEIKSLGGSIVINSRWGEGSVFTVRLPFTVSVNRALMVLIGEDRYAIPLNTIEGIVRVSPFELEHYYQDEQARFEYAGENYRVRYLGTLLSTDSRPKLEGQSLPMPVVLVRTAEHSMALQVDNLLGSREIVVKSLGQQFSNVQGLSGATVMGDGSVVVILDPHAMIRQEAALVHQATPLLQAEETVAAAEDEQQTVMVVDDSVTVRKVTSRFLEREGYNVITAKDGADALHVLQDHIPDVMLLDIEMPRMDGFEVAKNIRSSSRLKNIPIIMITSRTGQKHRDRALSLGVQRYMGKPYQEDALLDNIRDLIGVTVE